MLLVLQGQYHFELESRPVKVLQQLKYWFIVMITMHTRISQPSEKVHMLSVNVIRVSHMVNQFMPAAIKNC